MVVYKHRQIGTLVLVALGAGILMTFVGAPGSGTITAGLVVLLLLARQMIQPAD